MRNPYDITGERKKLPKEFVKRRLQSIAGFVFLLFLCEHLFTNSQATFFIGDDGKAFIDSVNFIRSLPYLPVIEIVFIALPLAIHVWFGIDRILTAKYNSFPTDGAQPAFKTYSRNQAYTWQRITSIILIFAIGLHVYYMRFQREPQEVNKEGTEYVVTLTDDPGLASVARRLDVQLEKAPNNTVKAYSDNVGTGLLLVLRDTYKSVFLCIVYSLFVLIAAFHGSNGLWTFSITWGVALTEHARELLRKVSTLLLILLLFFGLSCIWGVYWINLRS